MWTNLTGVVGGVLQKAQQIQQEIESQLDKAVANDGNQNQTNPVYFDEFGNKIEVQGAVKIVDKKEGLLSSRSSSSHGEKLRIIPQIEIANENEPVDNVTAKRRTENLQCRQTPIPPESDQSIRIFNDGVCTAKEWQSAQTQIAQHVAEMEQAESHLQEIIVMEQKSVQSYAKEIERLKAQLVTREKEFTAQLETEKKKTNDDWQQLITRQEQQFKLELAKYRDHDRGAFNNENNNNNAQASVNQQVLEAEVMDLRQRLAERERSMESTALLLSEAHQQLENLQVEVEKKDQTISQLQLDLTAAIASATASAASTGASSNSSSSGGVAALEREIQRLNEQLKLFETEGKVLAKKQSDMEKAVRTAKIELSKKEEEIKGLKKSKGELTGVIEETQDALKKQTQVNDNLNKSLSAMQAVCQASADKISRLEEEVRGRADEQANQRKALESAWAENTDLKRAVTEMKTECDDLRRRLGEGASRVMETESSRRDVEQREAVLRATSRQLQESLARQMSEASSREERLREELLEMRRRWQEAVALRESAASELSQATAPLLRQIAALQETLRLKVEQWQGIEASLSERALRAEAAAEAFEHRRLVLEEQAQAARQQLQTANNRLVDTQLRLETAEASLQRLRRAEGDWAEQKGELESKLAMEIAQAASLRSSLRELEMRHGLELQEAIEAVESRKEAEADKLRRELTLAREMVINSNNNLNHNYHSSSNGHRSRNLNNNHHSQASPVRGEEDEEEQLSALLLADDHDNKHGDGRNGYANHSLPSKLANGEASFVAAEKRWQRTRQRDEALQALQTQVNQLQSSRNALLEEVGYLSSRNAQLEEETASLPRLKESLEAAEKRLEVLLGLLGEKEEELEGAMQDMKEVKLMYRSQLEELLERALVQSQQQQSQSPSQEGKVDVS